MPKHISWRICLFLIRFLVMKLAPFSNKSGMFSQLSLREDREKFLHKTFGCLAITSYCGKLFERRTQGNKVHHMARVLTLSFPLKRAAKSSGSLWVGKHDSGTLTHEYWSTVRQTKNSSNWENTRALIIPVIKARILLQKYTQSLEASCQERR